LLWVGEPPQLGIVFDDLRLGLRESRSSTELRWPPAKACVGRLVAMASGQKVREWLTRGAMAYGKKYA
jgi:hypothetical protein